MKHLVTLMVASVMAVLLTACGEQAPKQPDVKVETTVPAAQQQPAAESSPAAADAAKQE